MQMQQCREKSHFVTTQQSSSCKTYLVKKKLIQITRSKSPEEYFHSPDYHFHKFDTIDHNNLSTLHPNLSTISVPCSNPSTPHRNNKLKYNKNYQQNTLDSTQKSQSISHINPIKNANPNNRQKISHISTKQRSAHSLLQTINRIKNFHYSTISHSKTSTKKQNIKPNLTINPQNLSILPKIQKNTTQKFKSQVSQRHQMVNHFRKNMRISQSDPYYILSKQIADKCSMQKQKYYKKLWKRKQKNRKQINLTSKNCNLYQSFQVNASILNKSLLKSSDISVKYNQDVEKRRQKCNWQENLRGNQQKRYVTIGQTSIEIQGLKGNGQNFNENVQIKPAISIENNRYLCQEVYKYHK